MIEVLRIYAKHWPYETGHLAEVTTEMRRLGPPTIRCVRYGDDLYALEGSHRLAAAHHLNLWPIVVEEAADAFGVDDFWGRVGYNLPVYVWGRYA